MLPGLGYSNCLRRCALMKHLQRLLPGACVLLFGLYVVPFLIIHAASVVGVEIEAGLKGVIVMLTTLVTFGITFVVTLIQYDGS